MLLSDRQAVVTASLRSLSRRLCHAQVRAMAALTDVALSGFPSYGMKFTENALEELNRNG